MVLVSACLAIHSFSSGMSHFYMFSASTQRFNSVFIMDSFCTTDEDPDL